MPENENGSDISYSMTPFTGTWTKALAAHLLRRTMFGPTNQQILDAVSAGMAPTVAALLQIPAVGLPLAYHPDETIASQGAPWNTSVYPSDQVQAQAVNSARAGSFIGWMYENMNNEQVSIAEKMCLFWQNHFASSVTFDMRATYDYFNLIRTHALGNFKQFVKDMTINPNMLIFLDGASNNPFSPNENYAREFLELFTIGKGPQIGPGDYTNYTEDDVAAGAKIFTGFLVDGLRSATLTDVTATFTPVLHDTSTKTLSAHFGSVQITDAGGNEYANYIDVVFQQGEVAKFICRKFYRYFVNYDLTPAVETSVIEEMATALIANNYDVLPVLAELFQSEHFYDISVRGALIRGPLDMLYSMVNGTESQNNFSLGTDYEMQTYIYSISSVLGQAYLEPPSVAGWPAYYQEPSFSRLWMNATHVKTRFDISSFFTIYTGIPVNGNNWKVNAIGFLDNLSIPADPVQVIDDIVDVFCPKGVEAIQKLILKSILTNGQPDFEWTVQYNAYAADPGNPTVSDPVKLRVELVLARVFQTPEFHTM
jgi:uncharacterized protein (DUF1800 family)